MTNSSPEYCEALGLVQDTLRLRLDARYSEYLGQRELMEFNESNLVIFALCNEGGRQRVIRDLDGKDHDVTYVARINLNVLDDKRVSTEILLLDDGQIWKFENRPGKKLHYSGMISPKELGAFLLELPSLQ